MTDKNENTDIKKIYSLILSLKDEITRLTLQIKALKGEVKEVKSNG